MAAPGRAERIVASLHCGAGSGAGALVGAVVGAAGPDLGLDAEAGAHLARAAAAVAGAVAERGFDDPAAAELDVSLVRSGHRAMVRIDDRGLPFNAAAEDEADADAIGRAFAAGWIDQLLHEWRGREGNRTTLVRHTDAGVDLREGAGEALPPPPAEPVAGDVPIEVRMGVPADAEAICRLTWRTYGYSYQHDEYYQPERLAQMLADGLQASFVAVTPDGEIVGHSALLLEHPGDVIVEGGRAMVDPRFRGHHLMYANRELRERWMHDHGVLALEGAAVTAHTRSQRDVPVTSVQLAFLPPISFRDIDGSEVPHRQAVVGGIVPFAPIPAQQVHLPRRDAAMLAEIYRLVELDRTDAGEAAPPGPDTTSSLELELRGDLGHAVVTATAVGADLATELARRMDAVRRAGIVVTYADVALADPATSWAADVLADAGFVFSGVQPLSAAGVDVVRYQYLGDTVVDPAEIHLKHPFARELLDYVLDQRPTAGSPA